MTNNNRKKLASVLLWLSVLLLVINLFAIDFSNFKPKELLSPLSNGLLIFAMFFTIKEINKKANN